MVQFLITNRYITTGGDINTVLGVILKEEIIGSNQDVSTTLSGSRNKQQPKLPTT